MHSWYLFKKDYATDYPNWGITYSARYATELGLDSKETYLAILNDLHVQSVRLPVYWSEVEKEDGDYDFSSIDWQIIEAAKRNVKVILVVGYRVPRWPECFAPAWAKDLPLDEFDAAMQNIITETVRHFRVYDNVIVWQVHNEPFLKSFGECRELTPEQVQGHVELVHKLDYRPVMLTESGELSTWIESSQLADMIGTSLYRTVWNKYIGYWRYPIPPAFYRLHADWVMKRYGVKKVIISELQAEPWPPGKSILATSLDEQFKSFDLHKLKHNADYARRTGISDIYFWGVEWWYWLKGQGHPEFWEYMKKVFALR